MATEPNSESHGFRFRLLDFPPEIIARVATFSPTNRLAFPTGALNRYLRLVLSDPRDIASRALVRYASPEMALVAEAVRVEDVSVISDLCERGADVNAHVQFRGEKCFPLQVAEAYGHLKAVQFLLNAGAIIVISPFRNAVLEASTHGHSDILKVLLDRGVDLARYDTGTSASGLLFRRAGRTPFVCCSTKNLIDHGISLWQCISLFKGVTLTSLTSCCLMVLN
ncbi:hypothetical protein M427DRAFT_336592 [Gonapodya prolifera JEL478]|uniref:Uncharacterized protein n=1 Tax=Gonapodya prolifera (strain JEL478) TaxID=1344416 RepID=A0A139ADZ9_GONPJ|nr:hypothetical protein M427DRAFT_336592 [Gonapodya prolifera JEL478]|eukprot:KXS14665.1 hypothetical protein M427DRAFT_336592 [Gonapodya prolifera JEL478]